MLNEKLLNEFREHIRREHCEATADSYYWTLKTHCIGATIGEINTAQFFDYLKDKLRLEGCGLGTIYRHVAAVKSFLRYLERYEDLEIFNLDKIKCKKPKPKPVVILTLKEISDVRLVDIETKYDLRDRALFEFLLDTWCRVSEATSIKWSEVDFQGGEVAVRGKGGRTRKLFVNNSVCWLLEMRREFPEAEYLFPSQYNTQWARGFAGAAIKKLARRAGLVKKVTPHTIRKTGITYAIWSGMDLKSVQTLAGHEDFETTFRYYVAVDEGMLREGHARLSEVLGAGV